VSTSSSRRQTSGIGWSSQGDPLRVQNLEIKGVITLKRKSYETNFLPKNPSIGIPSPSIKNLFRDKPLATCPEPQDLGRGGGSQNEDVQYLKQTGP